MENFNTLSNGEIQEMFPGWTWIEDYEKRTASLRLFLINLARNLERTPE